MDASSPGWRPTNCDPKLAQLSVIHRRGSPGQRVGAGRGLREGDHVADRLRSVNVRHDPVKAVSDAAVRRGSVAQRLEQEAEAGLGLLLGDAEDLEDGSLDVGTADSDRPPSELDAVPDDVVGESPRLAGRTGVELAG